jgi:hypothetical protein
MKSSRFHSRPSPSFYKNTSCEVGGKFFNFAREFERG